MPDVRAMTLRLEREQAEQLDLVAMVDEESVAEVVRMAIADYVACRTQDPSFQAALRRRIEFAQNMLPDQPGDNDA